jgi:hypothetical protein
MIIIRQITIEELHTNKRNRSSGRQNTINTINTNNTNANTIQVVNTSFSLCPENKSTANITITHMQQSFAGSNKITFNDNINYVQTDNIALDEEDKTKVELKKGQHSKNNSGHIITKTETLEPRNTKDSSKFKQAAKKSLTGGDKAMPTLKKTKGVDKKIFTKLNNEEMLKSLKKMKVVSFSLIFRKL